MELEFECAVQGAGLGDGGIWDSTLNGGIQAPVVFGLCGQLRSSEGTSVIPQAVCRRYQNIRYWSPGNGSDMGGERRPLRAKFLLPSVNSEDRHLHVERGGPENGLRVET